MTPEVSVIIPTYNRAALVERAISSVREPGSSVEIIVVDDASDDDTGARLSRRAELRYVRLAQNRGQAWARNAGADLARAEFIAFLDSDDTRVAGTLERQVRLLRGSAHAVLAYGRVSRIHDTATRAGSPVLQGDIYDQLLSFNLVAPSSAVLRRRDFLDCGGFDPRLRRSEEWDLWLRLCSRRPVVALDEVVAWIEPPEPGGHVSSDPVAMERTSLMLLRRHLRSPYSRVGSDEARSAERRIRRLRIDLMLWKVLGRPSPSLGLRMRCALWSCGIDPAYMASRTNIKNLVKLLWHRPSSGGVTPLEGFDDR